MIVPKKAQKTIWQWVYITWFCSIVIIIIAVLVFAIVAYQTFRGSELLIEMFHIKAVHCDQWACGGYI